jgi:hypothetical protein
MGYGISIPQREPLGHLGPNNLGVLGGWKGKAGPGSDTSDAISSGVLAVNERALIDGAEIYTAGASPEWAEPR